MLTNPLRFAGAAVAFLLVLSGCKQEWPTDPPDVTRPAVASIVPSGSSLMVPIATKISISFNEGIDPGCLPSCVTVKSSSGTVLAGSWTTAGATATFTPAARLDSTTRYDIIMKGAFTPDGKWLGPGLRDSYGNSMLNEYKMSFATEGSYGRTVIYMGKSDAFGSCGSAVGVGMVKDFQYSTIGEYSGDGELAVAVSPSGQELYVANGSGSTVDVFETATNQMIASIPLPDGITGPTFVEFTPNGSEAWVLSKYGLAAVVINTSSRQPVATIHLDTLVNGGDLYAMKFNHAGTRAYISTDAGLSLIVVDVTNRSVITTIPDLVKNGDPWMRAGAIEVTPDDAKVILAADYAMPQLVIVDAATNTFAQDLFIDQGLGYNSDSFLKIKGNSLYVLGRWGLGLEKIDLATLSVVATNMDQATSANQWGWMTGMTVGNDGVIYGMSYYGELWLFQQSTLAKLGILQMEVRENLAAK